MKNLIIPEAIFENINCKVAKKTIKDWLDNENSPYKNLYDDYLVNSNIFKIKTEHFPIVKKKMFSQENNYTVNISSNTKRKINNLIVIPGTFQYLSIVGNLTLNINNIENFIWINDWAELNEGIILEDPNGELLNTKWNNLTINTTNYLKLVLFDSIHDGNKGLQCKKLQINAKNGEFQIINQHNLEEVVFNLSGKSNCFINLNTRYLARFHNPNNLELLYDWNNKFIKRFNFDIKIQNCKKLQKIDFYTIPFFCLNTLSLKALDRECILVFNKNVEFEYSNCNNVEMSSIFSNFTVNQIQKVNNTMRNFKPFYKNEENRIEIKFGDFLKLLKKEVSKEIKKQLIEIQ